MEIDIKTTGIRDFKKNMRGKNTARYRWKRNIICNGTCDQALVVRPPTIHLIR